MATRRGVDLSSGQNRKLIFITVLQICKTISNHLGLKFESKLLMNSQCVFWVPPPPTWRFHVRHGIGQPPDLRAEQTESARICPSPEPKCLDISGHDGAPTRPRRSAADLYIIYARLAGLPLSLWPSAGPNLQSKIVLPSSTTVQHVMELDTTWV